jgi:hypothetical protein
MAAAARNAVAGPLVAVNGPHPAGNKSTKIVPSIASRVIVPIRDIIFMLRKRFRAVEHNNPPANRSYQKNRKDPQELRFLPKASALNGFLEGRIPHRGSITSATEIVKSSAAGCAKKNHGKRRGW